ncbi:tripartite tricarboxylate transporter substrate binding protein [Rhodosalinus halophilus]|uniref:Tripartite tricarboxylate transporter substrate binding protein n=1 Tax=Rhodosalinus halophilus TaxID=2259333 RepID=A0A365UB24_9RHOB|nr:tripartite tricarboxylate transporter substrate binding protein [Rhodosalinus halophilus]RBI86349.1 tripartite tricarboxylate transporter substrate binding protein [Rhodosalinus halophilus]
MKKILTAALAAPLAMAAAPAVAEYPEKPVEFVVPWPPGDLEDILTRMIAEDFQETYGVPAAVLNKPGGGGGPFPGAVEVAMAPPDGYTIGSFVIGVPVIGPQIGIPALDPDPFDPLGIFLTYPFVIAASGDAPYADMAALARHAQDNDVVLGHFGGAALPTRVTKALAREMGFAYSSDSAFDALDCNTLASGDADVINTTLQLILPCLDEVTMLAAMTSERIAILPETPTIGELAPELDISTWNGLFVHEDTPQDVRDKIIAVARQTIASDRAQQVAEETGALVYWMDAEASEAQIAADIETLERIDALLAD